MSSILSRSRTIDSACSWWVCIVSLGQVAGPARSNQLAAKIGCLAYLCSRHNGVVADNRFKASKDFDLGTLGHHAHEIVRVTKQKIDLAGDQRGVGRVAL